MTLCTRLVSAVVAWYKSTLLTALTISIVIDAGFRFFVTLRGINYRLALDSISLSYVTDKTTFNRRNTT